MRQNVALDTGKYVRAQLGMGNSCTQINLFRPDQYATFWTDSAGNPSSGWTQAAEQPGVWRQFIKLHAQPPFKPYIHRKRGLVQISFHVRTAVNHSYCPYFPRNSTRRPNCPDCAFLLVNFLLFILRRYQYLDYTMADGRMIHEWRMPSSGIWRRVVLVLTSVCSYLLNAGSSLADFFPLKMEEIRSSETSVHTRTIRRHIQEDGILHSHRRDNLKSYNSWMINQKDFGRKQQWSNRSNARIPAFSWRDWGKAWKNSGYPVRT
jgi:hypothetical protein